MLIFDVCHGWAGLLISTGLRYDKSARLGQHVVHALDVGVADALSQFIDPVAECVARDFLRLTLPIIRKCLLRIFQLRKCVDPEALLIHLGGGGFAFEAELCLADGRVRALYIERAVGAERLVGHARLLKQVLVLDSFLDERSLG